MSDTHPTAAADDSAVPIPANARALFAKMAAFNDAKHAAEVGELQTVRELCLAYNTVDEDAFGEAAEQLTYYGAQGTPPVAEYLSLEISALLGMAPGSGACLIGRVLNCVYRHPLLWEAVQARTGPLEPGSRRHRGRHQRGAVPVSYTHLTLPTKRIV